jgi:uncharacterized protein YbjQ (UPF0145 family)
VILTTTDTVPGFTITGTVGLVVGSIVYFGTKYNEGISDLNGKTTTDVPAVFERRRREALARLAANASHVGANAVVGVAYHSRDITQTWRELCAYGTAVVIDA